jgi:hypothetical protein
MELSGSGYLYTLAILGITFASMSAIVVALRHTTGAPPSPFHLYLTKFYIEQGFLVAGLSMLPVLLWIFPIPHPVVWQVASPVAAVALQLHGFSFSRRRRAVTQFRLAKSVKILIAVRFLFVLALLVNVIDMPAGINAGIYAAIVSYFLGQVCFLFSVRLNAFLVGPG